MPPRKSGPEYPPQRVYPVYETLTSHDGTPCTVVWGRTSMAPNRPPASLQVYNTAPSSASNGEGYAKSLYEGPLKLTGMSDFRERLDIYGLIMDESMSEDERVAKCIAHQRAEIEDRRVKGRQDLHMMCWHWGTCWYGHKYKRLILVINKETADWQDGEMLFVWFDSIRMPDEDYEPPEIRVERFKGLDKLLGQLRAVRGGFGIQGALDGGEFDDEYSEQNRWSFPPPRD